MQFSGSNRSEMDDNYLVSLVKDEADEGALLELMERHSGIFHQTVANFMPPSYTNSQREDVFEEKPTYFFEAIASFDEARNAKFSTWLANKTKYTLLTQRSKVKGQPTFCEYDDSLGGEHGLSPETYLLRKDQSEEILNLVLDKYGSEVYDIVKQKYFGGEKKTGQTFSQIADGLGVSPQAIQAKHKDAMLFLKKKLSYDF